MPSLDCCCHTLYSLTHPVSKCLLNMSAWKLGEAQNGSAFFLFVVVFFPADTALTKNNEI